MTQAPPPLPAKHARLLAADAKLDPVPDDIRSALRRAVFDGLAPGSPSSTASPDARAALPTKLAVKGIALSMLTFALGGALGYGIGRSRTSFPREGQAGDLSAAPASSISAIAASSTPSASVSVTTPESLPSVPSPSAPAHANRKVAPTPPSALDAERSLLDQARSALARGDGAGALVPIDEHAKRFPVGSLAEEREVLAVRALLRAGQTAAAERRIIAFRRLYPDSVFRGAIESATADAGAP